MEDTQSSLRSCILCLLPLLCPTQPPQPTISRHDLSRWEGDELRRWVKLMVSKWKQSQEEGMTKVYRRQSLVSVLLFQTKDGACRQCPRYSVILHQIITQVLRRALLLEMGTLNLRHSFALPPGAFSPNLLPVIVLCKLYWAVGNYE